MPSSKQENTLSDIIEMIGDLQTSSRSITGRTHEELNELANIIGKIQVNALILKYTKEVVNEADQLGVLKVTRDGRWYYLCSEQKEYVMCDPMELELMPVLNYWRAQDTERCLLLLQQENTL